MGKVVPLLDTKEEVRYGNKSCEMFTEMSKPSSFSSYEFGVFFSPIVYVLLHTAYLQTVN